MPIWKSASPFLSLKSQPLLGKFKPSQKKKTKQKKQAIRIVWNKSTCHLGGRPDSNSANWFSCADLRSRLILLQSAVGCSAGAVSPSHRPWSHWPPHMHACMHVQPFLHWWWLCVHACMLPSIWFSCSPHSLRKRSMPIVTIATAKGF